MSQYIQGHKYITIHHTVTAPAATKDDLPTIARSIENYHKTKSYAEAYKTGGEFGYFYAQYHYLFAQDGSYIQLHDTKYQRVHATDSARGTSSHNNHGISIGIVGNMDNTRPSAILLESISQLCAKLEKQYKVNFAIRGHKETALYVSASGTLYYPEKTGVYYTACPGAFMGTSKSGAIKDIINRTNQLLEEKPWYETVTEKELKLTNPEIAYLYNIDSKEKIKTYMANSVIDVKYEFGDYYLTQYSVTQKVKNGFKKGEWKIYNASEVSDLEKLRNEITRLTQELSAAQKGYDQLNKDLEEKNITIDQLRAQAIKDKKSYEDLELQMSEKKVIIKRLESDVKWMEDQEKELKGEIEELEKSLETCSQVAIPQMSWSEIFSGVLSKLTGKEPE